MLYIDWPLLDSNHSGEGSIGNKVGFKKKSLGVGNIVETLLIFTRKGLTNIVKPLFILGVPNRI